MKAEFSISTTYLVSWKIISNSNKWENILSCKKCPIGWVSQCHMNIIIIKNDKNFKRSNFIPITGASPLILAYYQHSIKMNVLKFTSYHEQNCSLGNTQ